MKPFRSRLRLVENRATSISKKIDAQLAKAPRAFVIARKSSPGTLLAAAKSLESDPERVFRESKEWLRKESNQLGDEVFSVANDARALGSVAKYLTGEIRELPAEVPAEIATLAREVKLGRATGVLVEAAVSRVAGLLDVAETKGLEAASLQAERVRKFRSVGHVAWRNNRHKWLKAQVALVNKGGVGYNAQRYIDEAMREGHKFEKLKAAYHSIYLHGKGRKANPKRRIPKV